MPRPAEKAGTPRSNENRSLPGGAAAPRRSCPADGRGLCGPSAAGPPLGPGPGGLRLEARPSPEGFRTVTYGGDQKSQNPEPEAPGLPSTVAALRQLARTRGITTAGGSPRPERRTCCWSWPEIWLAPSGWQMFLSSSGYHVHASSCFLSITRTSLSLAKPLSLRRLT